MTRPLRTGAALSMVVLLLCAGVGLGHAKLLRSEPAAEAKVAAPKVVRVWFKLAAGEELDARSSISVWNAAGTRVDDGKGGLDLADLDRRTLMARVKSLLPGVYTVKWRAVSAPDGTAAQGSFRFTVVKK